jgi:hypothetical protein
MWTTLGLSLRVSIKSTRQFSSTVHRGIRLGAMTPLPPKLHKRSNTICYDATGITPLRGARRSSTSVNSDPSKPYYQHLTNTGSEPGVDVKRDADSYTHLNKPTRVTVG